MQILPDKKSAQHLYGLLVCIIFVLIFVAIAEVIDPSDKKRNHTPIKQETPSVMAGPVHSTSTIPYRFDPRTKREASTTPQFVLLSFDGSKSIEMWKETIKFAEEMNATNTPLHFTYFINSAYFLSPENKDRYSPPNEAVGNSAIGFAESFPSIDQRVGEINRALSYGHEIGSHAAGHWLGGGWSTEDWEKEFASFSDLLFNYKKNNPQYKFTQTFNLTKLQIRGFRAPSLSINENMYSTLSKDGFYYDSSEIATSDEWPHRDKGGIWHIPISTIYFPAMHKSIIAVDYSIWMNHTEGMNLLKRGTPEWDTDLKGITDGYIKHFERTYASDRAPIVIDDHFSTWNDGLYWEAMKGFAKSVCGRPYVRCTTFSGLVDYMETKN